MLKDIVRSSSATIAEIAHAVDALDHAARVAQVRTLGRRDQARLFEKAADAAALDAAHFVPDASSLRPVHHEGWNTLPVGVAALKGFQKRFARPEDGSGRLFGYNEGATRGLLGPGYFVAYDCQDHATWSGRGSWVVDYFQVPDGPVPDGWPVVKPNSKGLQVLVYNGTRDFMRRVSTTMSIGAAYKGETALHNYFVLVREG
ncbi:MAG: hypothetical protein ACI8PZ_005637 [Myxococcota bacterium]|jgi:hypothetical protein